MRLIVVSIFIVCVMGDTSYDEYAKERAQILQDEFDLSIGGKSNVTDKESIVNKCLMKYKFEELDYDFNNPRYFNFSHHFFTYKNNIKNSKVFKIIKDMPKAASLHIHDTALLGPDYVVNITYNKYLYVCFEKNDVTLKFSDKTPTTDCGSKWQLMSEARSSSKNVKDFDAQLRQYFTLYVDDPDIAYPSINEIWAAFRKFLTRITPLLSYRPVWEQYFYDAMKTFREDNIMYMEVRTVLPALYELNGTINDPIITAESYKKTINRFIKDYPDFMGAKLIYAPNRQVDKTTLDGYLQLTRRLKQAIPEIFAGFDLAGQEDLGKPLVEFVPQLLAEKNLTYFFHAGETDWYGTSTDENLLDAILLGTKRIGHGYALAKHPRLIKAVSQKKIAIEVNVLSNTVATLVRDVRNHPLNIFIAHNLPVVLSSDDPGAWEANASSDDYYVAFVGVASRLADIRLLKQLAINSIQYSALDSTAQSNALNIYKSRWDDFINKFDCSRY